jgi:OOP family OmpA-OmpF porin
MKPHGSLHALALIFVLGACTPDAGEGAGNSPDLAVTSKPGSIATPAPEETEMVSILRDDIARPDLPETPLEPLNITIGFPEGGVVIDAAALLALQEVLGSDQFALNGPIVLGGHSDAGGSDAVNARASRRRAERVGDWLIENGAAQERITVIAFGEQNPNRPNALPDGTPNAAGRALNRRVEVLIVPPETASGASGAADKAAAGVPQ